MCPYSEYFYTMVSNKHQLINVKVCPKEKSYFSLHGFFYVCVCVSFVKPLEPQCLISHRPKEVLKI